MPVIRIENLGAAQVDTPFTIGQVFVQGELKVDQVLSGKLDNGNLIPLQVDVKATHADGSVRHAVISGKLPKIDALQTIELALVQVGSGAPTFAPVAFMRKAHDANVSTSIKVDGVDYTALMREAVPTGPCDWLYGEIVYETISEARFKDLAGVVHPHLVARFGVRSYRGSHTRIEIVIENNRTFTPGSQNYVYEPVINVSNSLVQPQLVNPHFHHARWRTVFWLDNATAPNLHIKPDTAYLMKSKAIPNYDLSTLPEEAVIANWLRNIGHSWARSLGGVGPMKIGPVQPGMPGTGGRPDIAPLPGWTVCYLLSHDKRVYDVMMAAADGSGSWPIHYRDENTGYPVRLDNDVNRNISTHMNMANTKPLPIPRTVAGKSWPGVNPGTPEAVSLQPDTAHQPSLVYVPYLLTGDYYYLEELHFWTVWNTLETAPGNRGFEKGLLNWQQVRGQAWSLRTLGHAAYITPDDHNMKGYFLKQLDNNLDWYHQTYVVGNPNELGIYDGSGYASFQISHGMAPFQDSYFTWAFGYLAELGFEKALPILKWKAKFLKGCLLDPEFDQIAAMDFFLQVRVNGYIPAVPAVPYRAAVEYQPAVAATATTAAKPEVKALPEQLAKPAIPAVPPSPIYKTFGEVYRKNFSGLEIKDDNRNLRSHPSGTLFIDQPRGSQQQADWLAQAFKYTWKKGQWFGYASYEMGYAANAQPALAVITDLAEASDGWRVFDARAVKPNYRKGPQFNIIPRNPLAPVVPVEPPKPVDPPPVVVTPPVEPPPVKPVEPPVVVTPPPVTTPPVEPVFVPNARTKLEIAIQLYGQQAAVQATHRDAANKALQELLDAEAAKQQPKG